MEKIDEFVPFLKKEFEKYEFLVNGDLIECKNFELEQKGKIYWKFDGDSTDGGVINLYAESKCTINDREKALQIVNDYNKGLLIKDPCHNYCSASLTESNTLILKSVFFTYNRLMLDDYVGFYYAAMPTFAAIRALKWWDDLAQRIEKGEPANKDFITYTNVDWYKRRSKGRQLEPIDLIVGEIKKIHEEQKKREEEERKRIEEEKSKEEARKKAEEEERKRIEEEKSKEEARKKAEEEKKKREAAIGKVRSKVSSVFGNIAKKISYPSTMKRILKAVAERNKGNLALQEDDNVFLMREYSEGNFYLIYSKDNTNPSVDVVFRSCEFENKAKMDDMGDTIVKAGINTKFDAYTNSDNTILFRKTIPIQDIEDESKAIADIDEGVGILINAVVEVRDKWQKWPTKQEVETRRRAKAAKEEAERREREAREARERKAAEARKREQMIKECKLKIGDLKTEVAKRKADYANYKNNDNLKDYFKRAIAQAEADLQKEKNKLLKLEAGVDLSKIY